MPLSGSSPGTPTSGATEPITLDEAKLHLKVDDTADDDLITRLITAVRLDAELYLNRRMMTTTETLTLPSFTDPLSGTSCYIDLPNPPVQSITHVKYYDTAGTLTTLSSSCYELDTSKDRARLWLAYNQSWPSTRSQWNAVVITYVAGYASADAVPDNWKAALLLGVANLYENRGDDGSQELPQAAKNLLGKRRITPV